MHNPTGGTSHDDHEEAPLGVLLIILLLIITTAPRVIEIRIQRRSQM
jgi:hypothetical protein